MSPIENQIVDEMIHQMLDIHRFEAGLEVMVAGMLRKMLQELVQEILKSGMDTNRTSWQRSRFEGLIKGVTRNIQGTYAGIDSAMGEQIAGMVEIAANGSIRAINEVLGGDLLQPIRWSSERLQAFAGNSMIDGAPSAEWWSRQGDFVTQRFTDQMRSGMLLGESIPQLAKRVSLDSELAGTVGKNAQTLVRTSALAAANAANLEAWRGNADIVESLQWIATLDPRTCIACGQLDGRKWPNVAGHPVPPHHWNCRCFLIPVTKSFEQLARESHGNSRIARELDQMQANGSTRASMEGQVSAKTSYEQWLKNQPKERQIDILGAAKYEVWSKQKLSLTDLLDQRGNPLTLDELRKKWA